MKCEVFGFLFDVDWQTTKRNNLCSFPAWAMFLSRRQHHHGQASICRARTARHFCCIQRAAARRLSGMCVLARALPFLWLGLQVKCDIPPSPERRFVFFFRFFVPPLGRARKPAEHETDRLFSQVLPQPNHHNWPKDKFILLWDLSLFLAACLFVLIMLAHFFVNQTIKFTAFCVKFLCGWYIEATIYTVCCMYFCQELLVSICGKRGDRFVKIGMYVWQEVALPAYYYYERTCEASHNRSAQVCRRPNCLVKLLYRIVQKQYVYSTVCDISYLLFPPRPCPGLNSYIW